MSNDFQNKMYQYEVTPPEKVWEKITAALDEREPEKEFSSKLYDLEATPPVTAWEKIKSLLDAKHEMAVTKQRKVSFLYRYAAAAILLCLVVFGGIRLLNNKPGKNKLAKEETISPTKDPAISSNTETDNNSNKNISAPDETRDDVALENSKKTFAKLDDADRNKIKKIMTAPADLINYITDEIPGRLHYAGFSSLHAVHGEGSDQLGDRYIQLMTPEGNLIRMAKKWSDLACCVTGEERDANCKDKLQQWREKIACSPLVPSPGNLLDILNLVNSIRDNNP